MAERDRTSLNSFLLSAVCAKVGAEDYHNALVRRFEDHMMLVFRGAVTAFTAYKVSRVPKDLRLIDATSATPSAGTHGEMRL